MPTHFSLSLSLCLYLSLDLSLSLFLSSPLCVLGFIYLYLSIIVTPEYVVFISFLFNSYAAASVRKLNAYLKLKSSQLLSNVLDPRKKSSSCSINIPLLAGCVSVRTSCDYTVSWTFRTLRGARDLETSREWLDKPPRLLFSFTFQLLEDKQKMRHGYQKRKIVLQIRAILINGTRGTQKWSTSYLQLFPTGINGHQEFSRIKDTKKRSKILSTESLFWTSITQQQFEVSVTAAVQVGYVRAREGGALLGQENTEPRAFEMARHWVADFWVVHHLGRAPMRLVAQLNCAQMGNTVKDECHSVRRSVEPRIMWVVAAWVGAHLGCALQRVALVYRRAKKWRSTGYKPPRQAVVKSSRQNSYDLPNPKMGPPCQNLLWYHWHTEATQISQVLFDHFGNVESTAERNERERERERVFFLSDNNRHHFFNNGNHCACAHARSGDILVPTCSVTSRIHFDRRITCKIVQSGPLPWQQAIEKWYGPLSWQRAADRRGQRWKDMWEQQSSIRIWAGTRLHPDLGTAGLGQDLPGPSRTLMLDRQKCLQHTSGITSKTSWQFYFVDLVAMCWEIPLNILMITFQKKLPTSSGTKQALHVNSKMRLMANGNFYLAISIKEHGRSFLSRRLHSLTCIQYDRGEAPLCRTPHHRHAKQWHGYRVLGRNSWRSIQR